MNQRSDEVLEIFEVAFGGQGVGRLSDGKICFVSGVMVGERVGVRVVKESKGHVQAEVTHFIERSVSRVDPPCPVFGLCGGCAYQHMPYEMQLAVKTEQVRSVLARLGGISDCDVQPCVASPQPYGYRNRITVHIRQGKTGFHRRGGRGLVDVARCYLASDPVNAKLAALRAREAFDGPCVIREEGPQEGFRQTNDAVAALLLDAVTAACSQDSEIVIDAYCGSGFFAKRLVCSARRVIGIEWNANAIHAANAGAGEGEEYREGDVSDVLPPLLAELTESRATVLLDPPAQGVSPEVVSALVDHPVEQILYISCDPSTLARDLKILGRVYEVVSIQPFDMFPQTAQVEVLAGLALRKDQV